MSCIKSRQWPSLATNLLLSVLYIIRLITVYKVGYRFQSWRLVNQLWASSSDHGGHGAPWWPWDVIALGALFLFQNYFYQASVESPFFELLIGLTNIIIRLKQTAKKDLVGFKWHLTEEGRKEGKGRKFLPPPDGSKESFHMKPHTHRVQQLLGSQHNHQSTSNW